MLFPFYFSMNAQTALQEPVEQTYTGTFSIQDEQFSIWNEEQYIPIFIKGINLGVSVPGTQPGQLAATRKDYRRWFSLIREAGYNTIRTYTLHFPRFYEELMFYNLDNPRSPLLLIQGVWLEEQLVPGDLYQLSSSFNQEIKEVIRAVHGNIDIDHRFGKAYGSFNADVSDWIAGYLIGREIFPVEVALTNQAHPEKTVFHGTYLMHPEEASPVEVWMLEHLDSLMMYEKENFGTLRPAGFSSWPTLDPLTHPTEGLLYDSQEDQQQIDLAGVSWPDSSGGFFIGYHAYPYYPDFIVQDPDYNSAADEFGPNSYLGYLSDLKDHYRGIPLIIAEFGVPSSWGSAHLTPTGMHHGGITEEEQGIYSIRMMDNIREAGCAGGIQFSLIDEWFKQTWITNPYSSGEFRHYWHNITAPEQNFGILAYMPRPGSFYQAGNFEKSEINRISLSSDYTFFRTRLYMDTEKHMDETLWVAFDTYEPGLGESMLPDGTSIGMDGDTLRAEFALRIPMQGEVAELFVIPSYDVFGVRDQVRLDTLTSARKDNGTWNPVRWKTNYFYDITQYIGKLKISDSYDPYQFLHAVTIFNDSIEIRIPWTLLNFNAPSERRAMHYLSYQSGSEIVITQSDTLSDGIAITVAGPDRIYQSERYSWDPWDYEKIVNDPPLERKKKSFFELKKALPRFNSPPVGFADTFSIDPGVTLQVGSEHGLLSNDIDIDGNDLEVQLSFGNSPLYGTVQLHPNGSFYYTPDEGFRGKDMFSYFLNDGYSYSTLIPVTLNVDYPLGTVNPLAGEEQHHFTIFPNPGRGVFNISGQSMDHAGWLTVTDPSGREILRQPLGKENNAVQLEHALPGLYIFSINTGNRVENHRVVIQ